MFGKHGVNSTYFSGAGLSLRPVNVLNIFIQKLTDHLNVLYPTLSERLCDINGKIFLLKLSDMPFDSILTIKDSKILSRIVKKTSKQLTDVTIYASGKVFLSLLEGRSDGDALFFARNIQIEGNVEALLVLRNALDNEQISLRNMICSMFGPLYGFALSASGPLEKIALSFLRDTARIHTFINDRLRVKNVR